MTELGAVCSASWRRWPKAAASRLPTQEVAFIRFCVGLAAVGAAARHPRGRAHNWRGLFWRGAFGGAAVLCYFLAIEHLPVGMATLLNYTAPVFTALWAWLFLGERSALPALGALALTTGGRRSGGHRRAPPGWRRARRLADRRRPRRRAVGRGGGDDPRGAQDRRRVGDFAALLRRRRDHHRRAGGARLGAADGAEWAVMVGVGVTSVVAQMMMT